MNFTSLIVFSLLICLALSEKKLPPNIVQTYLNDLSSRGYDTKTPPEGWNGYGSPVRVLSTMYILNIHEVDDLNLEYAAQFYYRQSWNDTRLQYDYPNVDLITFSDLNNIWMPDLFFVQEKDGKMHNLIGPNVFCRVSPNGEVFCSERFTIKFSCPMDFRKYPHDTQECTFSIESYGYTRDNIEVNWDSSKHDPLMASNELTLLDFDLISAKGSTKEVSMTSGTYRALQVHLTFRRKIGFFVTRLYVPFIILVLVAWLSFFIKTKERLLRMVLLIVVLFLMTNIAAGINDYIPPSPYTKGSDVWIAVCESLVFASFLELILVAVISLKEKKDKKRGKCDEEMPVLGDAKEKIIPTNTDSLTSSANMVACRMKGNRMSERIDFACKVVYPFIFLLFNVIYWSIYCSGY